MKVATIVFAAALAFSGTAALAHAHKYKRHSMHHSMNKMQGSENGGNPNGTAGGPTTTSGTGSSKFGGSTPGTSGKQ